MEVNKREMRIKVPFWLQNRERLDYLRAERPKSPNAWRYKSQLDIQCPKELEKRKNFKI